MQMFKSGTIYLSFHTINLLAKFENTFLIINNEYAGNVVFGIILNFLRSILFEEDLV